MRYLLAFAVLVLMTVCARAEESVTVMLKNDSSYTGILVVKSASEVVLRLEDGSIKSIRRTVIREIISHGEVQATTPSAASDTSKTTDATKGPAKTTNYEIRQRKNKEDDPRSFWCVGATLITPASFNIRTGFNENRMAYHISGLYFGSSGGVQLNAMYAFSKSDNTENYIGLALGTMTIHFGKAIGDFHAGDYKWNYVGPVYVLHTGGFLLEGGLSIGSGDFTNPQLLLQIGYVPKFW